MATSTAISDPCSQFHTLIKPTQLLQVLGYGSDSCHLSLYLNTIY